MSYLDNTSMKIVCTFVLAVSILSNLVCSKTDLQVQIAGEDVHIYRDVNDSLSLNCTTTSNSGPIDSIFWKINGRSVNTPSSSDHWSMLFIRRLSRSDAGYYECTVTSHGEQQTASVFVNIKGKPMIFKSGESKLFTRSPVWPYSDESLKLHCFATGSKVITFRWLKKGKELKESDSSPYIRIIKNKNSCSLQMFVLNFKKANFTCEARNEYGMDNYSIGVSVKKRVPGPIKTRAERSVVFSNIGQTSELVCDGENINELFADTTWFIKGKQLTDELIENSKRLHSKVVFDRSKMSLRMALTINQTSLADAGNYTCQVTYLQDTFNKTIVLAVKGKGRRGDIKGLTTPDLIGLIIGVILVVIVFLILMLCYIKRKKIDYPPIPEGNFEYGAFITYNSQDFHWVEVNLLPLLEANGIEFCIHYRNFELGVAIQENMVNSIYRSRVVIVVMSNNYMKSKYCRAELDYAMHRALEEHGTNPLIILQIDPTIQKSKLPREIKNKTFLDFTSDVEKATWESRLLKYVKWNGNDENENEQGKNEEHDALIKQRQEEKKTSAVV